MVFFFFLGFNPTDRQTQYQETHSTVNEKKRGLGFKSMHNKNAYTTDLPFGIWFFIVEKARSSRVKLSLKIT